MRIMALVATALTGLVSTADAQQLAFPGAEGYGRFAVGGRGGAVYWVTNLGNSGLGSLRACAEASGPRTCMFRVGGAIVATGTAIQVTNPFLTIAGETAPPPGITLQVESSLNTDPMIVNANDVIIRHIASESSRRTGGSSNTRDGFSVTDTSNDVILDHMSFRFGIDETLEVNGCDTTVQNSIVAWGLEDAGHEEGLHSKGILAQNIAPGCSISLLRVLLAHANDRMPDIERYDNVQIVNMLSYNVDSDFGEFRTPNDSTMNLDVISSECRAGPATLGTVPPCIRIAEAVGGTGVFEVYVSDIIPAAGSTVLGTGDEVWQVGSPHSMPTIASVIAASNINSMLPSVGRTLPMRDQLDRQVVTNALTAGTDTAATAGGNILNSVPPTVSRAAADAAMNGLIASCSSGCDWRIVDSDGDGLPNYYEATNGLDAYDPADGAADSGDGYTNLEKYLHILAARPPL